MSLFSKFSQLVNIAPFIQFVGLMFVFAGLIAHHHWFGIPLAYIGAASSLAGFAYDLLYP